MGFDEDEILVIADAPRRPRFTIRALMLLVVADALVAWAARQLTWRDLRWLGTLLVMESPALLGMAWSVWKIYRNPPHRQAAPIAGLILSTLGLVACPMVSMAIGFPWK